MSKNIIYVVEMFFSAKRSRPEKWEPMIEVTLSVTEAEGNRKLKRMKAQHPSCKFRLSEYAPTKSTQNE